MIPYVGMPQFLFWSLPPEAADVFPLPFAPGETTDNASGESGRSAVSGLEAEAGAVCVCVVCVVCVCVGFQKETWAPEFRAKKNGQSMGHAWAIQC